MLKNRIWIWVLTLAFLVIGCDSPSNHPVEIVDSTDIVSNKELYIKNQKKELDTYYFGFDSRNSPQEDAAQYTPLMKYLEKETGLKFKLHFTSKNSSTINDIGSGKTHFALMGAMGFLEAKMKFDAKIIVRGVNQNGESKYRSYFVTRTDEDISDIKGTRFAFGNISSTQGHLIPKIELKNQGIPLESFSAITYTNSHQKCAESIISGNYDVCAMQDQLAEKLFKEGHVKIIFKSSWYPSSGVVAGNSIEKNIVDKVTKALLKFDPIGKDKTGLFNWENTEMPLGFVNASSSDYDDLKNYAHELEMLQE